MHEAASHSANSFLTLTFDDDHLDPNYSLSRRTWPTFANKLRKAFGPFRYYQCGEYGEHTGRPHHHASIFGLDFSHDRTPHSKTAAGDQLYESPRLSEVWGQGSAVIGSLTFETANYVAGYIMKKINGEQATDHYAGTLPEFGSMSRMPGLGKKWIDKYIQEVYPDDFVVINGKKASPPKFYDAQLEVSDPAAFKQLKKERITKGEQNPQDQTWQRLETREICRKAASTLYPRTL